MFFYVSISVGINFLAHLICPVDALCRFRVKLSTSEPVSHHVEEPRHVDHPLLVDGRVEVVGALEHERVEAGG